MSFTIGDGEFVTVRGASGAGKSTLMNIVGCLDTPTSGSYRLAGEDVSSYSDQQRSRVRNLRIGFIFQSFHLGNRLNAVENVDLPLMLAGIATAARRRTALAVLEVLEKTLHEQENAKEE